MININELKVGDKIRRKNWHNKYLVVEWFSDGTVCGTVIELTNKFKVVYSLDEDWERYKDLVKEEKIYQWVVQNNNGFFYFIATEKYLKEHTNFNYCRYDQAFNSDGSLNLDNFKKAVE